MSKKSNKSNKKKRKHGTEDAGESSDEKAQGNNKGRANSNGNTHKKNKKYCHHCKKVGHFISECWQKHKNLRPQNVTHSTNNQGKKNFTQQDFQNFMSTLINQVNKNEKNNHKNVDAGEDDESLDLHLFDKLNIKDREFSINENSNNSSDDVSLYSVSSLSDDAFDAHPFAKKQKVEEKSEQNYFTTDIIVEIKNRDGNIVPIHALLDTGTTATILLREFVAKGRIKATSKRHTKWRTLGGTFTTKTESLIDFKFPESNQDKTITWPVHVDEKTQRKDTHYDMIIGMDVMSALGIVIDCAEKTINWDGHEIPMKTRKHLQDEEVLQQLYYLATTPEVLEEAKKRQTRVLDADYSQVEIDLFVQELQHLSPQERKLLATTLKKFPTLFSGGLGELKIRPISLELIEGAKPYHAKPFPVPKSLEVTTKKEVSRLTNIGVLKKDPNSEWAAPTFIQPKKTGDVRVLTDFRKLNAVIKRKPFPLPKIAELLRKLHHFRWATAIDLSMGYYHIPLDMEAQKLCTTILPWGKYQYLRLPMGIKTSPDIFQNIMNELLGDMPEIFVYLDDILIVSDGSFQDHLALVEKVLTRLQEANFRANLKKCFFGEPKLEYLGYIISHHGIEPQPKKVEAIVRLSPPKTKRQLRHFLG